MSNCLCRTYTNFFGLFVELLLLKYFYIEVFKFLSFISLKILFACLFVVVETAAEEAKVSLIEPCSIGSQMSTNLIKNVFEIFL